MPVSKTVRDYGEVQLIKLIDEIIYQKKGTHLLNDDAFFLRLKRR